MGTADTRDRREDASTVGYRVLVGFDASRSSQHALAYAAGVARRMGTGLLVVHVDQMPVAAYPYGAFVVPMASTQTLKREVDDSLGTCGVPWALVRRTGAVNQALLAVAREHHADVVVVGRSCHKLHRIAGSVGVRIARGCEYPIIVVP